MVSSSSGAKLLRRMDLWRALGAGGVVVTLSSLRGSQKEMRHRIGDVEKLQKPLYENESWFDTVQRFCSYSSIPVRSSGIVSQLQLPLQYTLMEEAHTIGDRTLVEKEYDFIIVGYGTAGKACYDKLCRDCPTARIALIDPLQNPPNNTIDKLDFFEEPVIGLDPKRRVVKLHANHSTSSSSSLRYRHAVLLATGARGAPPPSYLLDDSVRDAVLEVHSTALLSQPRPTAEMVRQKAIQAAKQGQTVGILGSGWQAVDLAVATAAHATTATNKSNRPHLFFGHTTPLSFVLPNYLSVAVRKRLGAKRVVVHDQMVVRYVSEKQQNAANTATTANTTNKVTTPANNKQQHRLQLYTARSNDFMEGRKTVLDMLVVAPETAGPTGCAALPTADAPDFLREHATLKDRPWYQTWANLSATTHDDHHDNDDSNGSNKRTCSSMIACYKEDGRVAVNAELQACTGVYAAGSVAKYANSVTGHADVAGVGAESAVDAGQVAAGNMARQFVSSNYNSSSSGGGLFGSGNNSITDRALEVHTKDPLSVWRSDLRAPGSPTSLSKIGIQALCVGNCDSERFSTHGIWWTNQAAQQRMLRMMEKEDDGDNAAANDDRSSSTRRATRRRITKRTKASMLPVYGLGVVYYLDRNGKIHGIMTWGLPFTKTREDPSLNTALADHLKEMISTNGGFYAIESDRDQIRRTNYLVQQSRQLVALAFSFNSASTQRRRDHDNDCGKQLLQDFPRPLHRFTDARPPSVRSLGVLKRRDGHGHGILGQDMFDRYEDCVETPDYTEPEHNTPLVGSALAEQANTETMHKWMLWEQKEKRWDENEDRARPAKEDPLWIRKGDEMRNLTHQDSLGAAYGAMLFPGSR